MEIAKNQVLLLASLTAKKRAFNKLFKAKNSNLCNENLYIKCYDFC